MYGAPTSNITARRRREQSDKPGIAFLTVRRRTDTWSAGNYNPSPAAYVIIAAVLRRRFIFSVLAVETGKITHHPKPGSDNDHGEPEQVKIGIQKLIGSKSSLANRWIGGTMFISQL
jgi:hypothetical protein